ncbi:hypothetical protein EW146_g6173 [Bondarzewia mesenterica]|uniref:Carboxypeptidase n=1 Tax=Bondarzewia mesenterica TaxID=1095465 RepID=A0A4S4LPE8_9AGAM|nr:hypothetical protein EW146_g6173 [Bondarzewia mesenterica]
MSDLITLPHQYDDIPGPSWPGFECAKHINYQLIVPQPSDGFIHSQARTGRKREDPSASSSLRSSVLTSAYAPQRHIQAHDNYVRHLLASLRADPLSHLPEQKHFRSTRARKYLPSTPFFAFLFALFSLTAAADGATNATSSSVNAASSSSVSSLHASSSATPSSTVPSVAQPSIVPSKPGQLPNSFPHNYSEIPEGDFSPEWQDCLPNITFPLPRNFAGNVPVSRPNNAHPNNTLFFWGVESTTGSLTAQTGQLQLSPWMIWLGGGGGPGSSSLFTSMIGNGPMLFHNDFTITQNQYGLNGLMDIIWVDQPVGTGFSTVDSDGYVKDENQMASDFIGFLTNLVKVFPSLASRPLTLAGEDYAGIFIPYITQALLNSSSPVQLKKIAIGNGLFGGFDVYPNLVTISILESFPQLIGFDQDVFKSFQTQAHLCGFDLNLTYPQQELLPSFQPTVHPSSYWSSAPNEAPSALDRRERMRDQLGRRASVMLEKNSITLRTLRSRQQQSGSKLSNGTLNPSYGCALFDEMIDYAANFSRPWTPGSFDNSCTTSQNVVSPQASLDGGIYYNSIQVRGALHAPTSKNWSSVPSYPFGSTTNFSSSANIYGDPTQSHGVELIFYSGANNAIAHHRGLEILIQNTTFGGTRGFTRKPSTPWSDDDGNVAGIVHQERGIVYALFDGVGHLIPHFKPNAAYVFYRDFVFNTNSTGSLTVDDSNKPVVLGGESPEVADDVPRVASALFIGSATTASTLFVPSATVQAWESFVGQVAGGFDVVSSSGAHTGRCWTGSGAGVSAVLALWVGVLIGLGFRWI